MSSPRRLSRRNLLVKKGLSIPFGVLTILFLRCCRLSVPRCWIIYSDIFTFQQVSQEFLTVKVYFQIRTFFSFGIFLYDSFTMFCCEVVAKLDKLQIRNSHRVFFMCLVLFQYFDSLFYCLAYLFFSLSEHVISSLMSSGENQFRLIIHFGLNISTSCLLVG